MNALIYKLTKELGYNTNIVASSDGKTLFILTCAFDEEYLKKQALDLEYKLKLDIGRCDKESLEPCDSMYRPFTRIEKPENNPIISEINKILEALVDIDLN